MPRYKVVIERIIEETIEVSAEDELEAFDKVIDGDGALTGDYETSPQLIHMEEIDDD